MLCCCDRVSFYHSMIPLPLLSPHFYWEMMERRQINTSNTANQIINKFYDKEEYFKIKEFKYSPSDIIEICMNNNYDETIKKLIDTDDNNDI